MRETFKIGTTSEVENGYSRAVKAKGFIFVSGTSAWDVKTLTVDPDPVVQTHTCFRRLDDTLAHFGASLDDLVQLQVFLRDIALWNVVRGTAAEYIKRSGTTLFTAEVSLPVPEFAIELVAIAAAPEG